MISKEQKRTYWRAWWANRPPAKCHPERKAHAHGYCKQCCIKKSFRVASCHPGRPYIARGLCAVCYRSTPRAKKRAVLARRLKKYGLTPIEFEALWLSQCGACAVCSRKLKKMVFGSLQKPNDAHIDHSHSSGAVRGILCRQCNAGLGMFRDSVSALIKAASYLERHSQ